ncbi:Replication factor A protein 2 [Saxophila tyrrhenica]|uniref:Replication factor A protein 2 n=1 Tax=Saxophila tyrrhenica TaxID=1690608 RepID=A0AAV9NZT7_9PEZI|nr:Replication factor A protein 2 [Saxophila tyrrhenica]
MDYGYTTSYTAAGHSDGGGFLPNSQNPDSGGGAKRKFGTDTLRPVTIKQLVAAHHPSPDAEHFIIDSAEATQVTFVGQIRNISTQTTNVTYKLDDGTGIIEVKMWKDNDAPDEGRTGGLVEQGYARVWGRLKAFANKRHVGAQIIRPVADLNEVQYHLLEATAVHLHFSRGPLESMQAKGGAGAANGANGADGTDGGYAGNSAATTIPANLSLRAKKVLHCIQNAVQTQEGLHVEQIAAQTSMDFGEVQKAGDELQNNGLIYTTVDDLTWALLDV